MCAQVRPLAAVVRRGPFFVSSIILVIACTLPNGGRTSSVEGAKGLKVD